MPVMAKSVLLVLHEFDSDRWVPNYLEFEVNQVQVGSTFLTVCNEYDAIDWLSPNLSRSRLLQAFVDFALSLTKI